MKFIFTFLLSLVLSIFTVSADITINEIMYNPDGIDSGHEWIEIYSDEAVNLSGWKFYEANTDHKLTLINESWIVDGYAIIADEWGTFLADYPNFNGTLFDSTFSLKNSGGEYLALKNSLLDIIDEVNYSDRWGANGNGYTLEKINPNGTNEESNWAVSLVANGTPGSQNSVYGTGEVDYSKIEILEFIPNPEGYDNAPMPNGEWIELYNTINTAMNLKWMFFKDLAGHTLYITDTTVTDTTIIPANGYLVVYTNGKRGFLNNEGPEVLGFYDRDGELIKNVSYADPVEGNSYAFVDGAGWQSTMPTPGQENVNYSNFNQSSLIIEKIYDLGSDNIAKFGQSIRIKANIYKGDTTKNSIALWIEDDKGHKLSKQSKTNVYTRYTNYTLTLPIQITPNCDYNYEDDNYTIVMEGLNKRTTTSIEIEGLTRDLCSEKEIEKITGKKFEYELISAPDDVEAGKEFITKVRLINNENIIHGIEIWSYVYRGSKCYSGERDENKKILTLSRKDFLDIELKNTIHDAKPGDYKLKVLIKKDDLKTNKQITHNIKVISPLKPNITIEKFYTKAKEPENEIILTAILKNGEKEKINFSLILESFNNFLLQNISIKAKKEKTIELPVNIYPGNNIFFLKLEKNNNILDMKELLIKIDGDKIEQYSDTISLLSQFNQTINQKLPLQGTIDKITGDILLSQKEPKTVYESKNIKIRQLIPLFLIVFLVIFNAVLVWKR